MIKKHDPYSGGLSNVSIFSQQTTLYSMILSKKWVQRIKYIHQMMRDSHHPADLSSSRKTSNGRKQNWPPLVSQIDIQKVIFFGHNYNFLVVIQHTTKFYHQSFWTPKKIFKVNPTNETVVLRHPQMQGSFHMLSPSQLPMHSNH